MSDDVKKADGVYGDDQIELWRNRVERWGWPVTGHYMLAPDHDFAKSGDYTLLHGETLESHSLSAGDNTLEYEAAFWRLIFPRAQVATPNPARRLTDNQKGQDNE